ncbi:MAG: LysR family transcriptional regulator [Actinobacteria bacterium]|nr:LysR family transcriptional regulator [Actinomycetota bacterium]
MELRHLDAVLAVADEGSFTAAADALSTVQSNVSEQIRQLEAELGAALFVRSRRGAEPTDCGEVVLERARRIRRELESLRADLSMLQGLEVGDASFGVVGTASRWLVPELVADLRTRAPGVHLRIVEGASERLAAEVLDGDLTQAIVTEPVDDRRLTAETVLEEALVGVAPVGHTLPRSPVPLEALNALGLVVPPPPNPLRAEIEAAAARQGLALDVVVEVEGIRLIADLVAAGAGAAVLPETAVPEALEGVKVVSIAGLPPRRLALVSLRDAYLSIADRAVRDAALRMIRGRRVPGRSRRKSGGATATRAAGSAPRPPAAS